MCANALALETPQLPPLRAGGVNVVDSHNHPVLLQGVNLGGWLMIETWMTPADSSGLRDNYSIIQTLDRRFGVTEEQRLLRLYERSWITSKDLDNIKAQGLNLIRVPVWWLNFETTEGKWRASDAFEMLDWVVKEAGKRGIYTIIDMHGVVGGQWAVQSAGQSANTYWSNTAAQQATQILWSRIARHYAGNSDVMGYDLINEPAGAPRGEAVQAVYDNLYHTIRKVDPDHIIVMEGCFGSWGWSAMPNPSAYGWKNVVYEFHEYQWNSQTPDGVRRGIDSQVSDFHNHQSWNVPDLIGEFNCFGAGIDSWRYAISQFNNNGISWCSWAYKATAGPDPNSWGLYVPDPRAKRPPIPNLQSDSADAIATDWRQWTTDNGFVLNSMTGEALRGSRVLKSAK
jgi:hypothetical protein